MLLTNLLPGQGNGDFRIHAYAFDTEGHQVLLGSKNINCDNAGASKPFGTIDVPLPGDLASGSVYKNFGWVLTPQPAKIPEDGGTILVYVDGIPLGHPEYNAYRNDIAALFPRYANGQGAGGCFVLDTLQFDNDVHTIAWSVTDDHGNSEGIGSRFFMIQNDKLLLKADRHLLSVAAGSQPGILLPAKK